MKIAKWIAIVVLGVPLLVVAGAYVRNKSIGPVGWAEENTLDQLRTRMRDPESMLVRSSFVVEKVEANGDSEIWVCGIVDGKNGFGGYAGGTRFVSKSRHLKEFKAFDTLLVEVENGEDKLAAERVGQLSGFVQVYWNKYCVDAQHPPLQQP